MSSRTRPNTSARRPAAIISAEYASRYPVTVHSSSVSEASNWRWIVGSASTIAAFGTEVIPLASAIANSSRPEPLTPFSDIAAPP